MLQIAHFETLCEEINVNESIILLIGIRTKELNMKLGTKMISALFACCFFMGNSYADLTPNLIKTDYASARR